MKNTTENQENPYLTWKDVGFVIRQKSYEAVITFIKKHNIKPRKVSRKNVLYKRRDVYAAIDKL